MLQEITQHTFCSRAYSLASLFGVLLILKFFDRVGTYLVAALARVSVECTYMGFSLLLVLFVDFMQQAIIMDLVRISVRLTVYYWRLGELRQFKR